ncbi:tetratricopeptide repeat protein [Actinomadura logoneensis]|uniref:Tetratricopeptide repeat protein n=1 Tax=Actinomadura logoneensis TaxID=2293572 RepID=A0A372JAV2_9ACTN|nr:tetratricopeptide repeat protein [Actinomadura logoneensis]RFU37049.1 tetratricopeptide repeat protein [Actinomadura logoneensis]
MDELTARHDPNPYPGRRPFTDGERHRFFGRAKESEALAELWAHRPVTVLRGPSGCGRTSLIHAGAVPLLRDTRHDPLPVADAGPLAVPPQGRVLPNAAFPESDPYLLTLLAAWREDPGEANPVAAFLRRARRRGRPVAQRPVLFAVDCAERWFTGGPLSRGQLGLHELLRTVAADPGVRLLLSVREEEADHLVAAVVRHDLPVAEMRLGPLGWSGALAAVAEPAQRAGRPFEDGAAERLVDELSAAHEDGSVEPVLLQAACRTLWDRLDDPEETVSLRSIPRMDDILTDLCTATVNNIVDALGAAASSLDAVAEAEWLTLRTWERAPEDVARRAAEIPSTAKEAEGPAVEPGGGRRTPSAAALHLLREAHLVRNVRTDDGLTEVLQHPDLAYALVRLGERPGRSRFHAGPWSRLRAAETALAAGQVLLARGLAGSAAGHPDTDAGFQADVQTVLGNIAYLHGRYDEAARCHQRAGELLQTIGESTAVVRQLAAEGWSRFAAGDAERGVALLRSGADLAPGDAAVQVGLGRMLWRAGRPEAALAVLSGVLNRHGDVHEALEIRGEILADRGESESALRDLDRLGRSADPAARAARALALARRGRLDAARAEIGEAVEAGAESGPALYRAAQVELMTGDTGTATDLATRAVEARHPPLPEHLRAEAWRLLADV